MKAVIVSSGDGTRLRPITCSVPHCMLPVMGRPVIEHTVKLLIRHNINDITIESGYLLPETKKFFTLHNPCKAQINFSENVLFESFFKDNDVLFISDSILTDANLEEFISLYTHSGSDAAILANHTKAPHRYGIVETDKENFLTSYTPCPDLTKTLGIPFSGIAIVKKATNINGCKSFHTLLEKLSAEKKSVYCYAPSCYVRDISDFDSYRRACRDFMDKKIDLPFPCGEKAPGVWIEDDATVMQGAILSSPVYIGKRSFISKGARIDSYAQIGHSVTIECYADIKRSIVMNNSHISESVSLRGAIIGENCRIGRESAAYEGSVLGFGSAVGKHCTLKTSVHIWPDKFIGDDKFLSENIMWEGIGQPENLCDGSSTGIINLDITPEFATKFARAVTTLLGKKIAVSYEGNGAGAMIKNALIAGIHSGGGIAYDMGEQPLPITRNGVRFYSLDGGIALSVNQQESSLYGSLDIITSAGISPDKDTIAKLRELIDSSSSQKASAHIIQECEFLFEYKLYYLKQLINSTSRKPLGAKILIHTPSIWAKNLLKSAATDIDCEFDFSDSYDPDIFAKKVTDGAYHMGVICDFKGETLTVVTESGRILSEFDYCALTSLIILKSFPDAEIYVPASAPDSIEQLALKYSGTVHRTKLSPPILMNELSKSELKMFLHQFIFRFDAVGAIILLLDYLYTKKVTPDTLMQEVPPSFVVTTTVSYPKNDRENAFRKIYMHHPPEEDTSEGEFKIKFKNGWVLVVPSFEENHIKVISHGTTTEYAREIADICVDDLT